jgi:hypothetical protein
MRRFGYALLLCVALCVVDVPEATAQFTPGNLVVSQVGDGTQTGNTFVPVRLREFTTTGTATGYSVDLPFTGADRLTSTLGQVTEGVLTRSVDGRYLTYIGYDSDPGFPGGFSSTSNPVPRAVVRIDSNGNTTKQIVNNIFEGSNARSVVSTNGTDLWMGGGSILATTATGGVMHGQMGSPERVKLTTATTAINDARVVNIFNNTLFFSVGGATNGGIWQVGTAGTLPTTTGQNSTRIIAGSGAQDFFFVDADNSGSITSGDVFYVSDERTVATGGGIQKWRFSSSWNLDYTITGGSTLGVRGLAGYAVNNDVFLYATTAASTMGGSNLLVSITDTLSAGSGTPNTSSYNVLAASGTNLIFRGVEFAPFLPNANLPEPSSFLFCVLVGGVCLIPRKK